MAEKLEVNLPADATLTSDNFSLNSDGSVTVKNSELSKFLQDRLTAATNDTNVAATGVGVVVVPT